MKVMLREVVVKLELLQLFKVSVITIINLCHLCLNNSVILVGNGKFSSTMYIHSNVAPSDGVFTIAMLNQDFS
jgi:hypothetical protein